MQDRVTNVDIPICKKVLPLVYTDSLSYYETLCGFVGKLNEVIDFANSLTDEILEEAKAYTDEQIAQTFEEVDRKITELNELIAQTTEDFNLLVAETVETFNGIVNDLQAQYARFTNYVNGELVRVDRRIDDTNQRLDDSVVAINASVDLKIETAKQEIIEDMAGNLPNQLKVLNILEGDKVTIQEMFDYICNQFITDGITVTEYISRAITLNRIATINRTVADIIKYGNTILVQ